MRLVKAIAAELFGMFIDDRSLAVAVLVLVLAVAIALRVGFRYPVIGAVALSTGLAVLLTENVVRSARAATKLPRR
jgi:hypothetical protein